MFIKCIASDGWNSLGFPSTASLFLQLKCSNLSHELSMILNIQLSNINASRIKQAHGYIWDHSRDHVLILYAMLLFMLHYFIQYSGSSECLFTLRIILWCEPTLLKKQRKETVKTNRVKQVDYSTWKKKIFGAKSCTVFFGCPYKTKIKHMSMNTPSLLISLVYAVLFCMKILFNDSTHPSLANAQGKSSLDFILNSNFTVILKFILSSGSRLHFELFKQGRETKSLVTSTYKTFTKQCIILS